VARVFTALDSGNPPSRQPSTTIEERSNGRIRDPFGHLWVLSQELTA
jgi:hypothetical protein